MGKYLQAYEIDAYIQGMINGLKEFPLIDCSTDYVIGLLKDIQKKLGIKEDKEKDVKKQPT